MVHFNEQLKQLHQQTARKKYLENVLKDLYAQQEELVPKVAELQEIKMDEEEDVERLEGGSLAAFFYEVIGKMDEKLDQERQEAYAASVKYDAAVRELEVTVYEIQKNEKELEGLQNCEVEYAKLLKEKAEAIKSIAGAEAEEILRTEEKLLFVESQMKEIREAIEAGTRCYNVAEAVRSELDSANGWATWDMLGGGLFSNIMKHDHLDSAQQKVNQLQLQLRRFKTELADVKISADVKVNFEGFTKFADFFFDNLFVDWEIKDRIGRSRQSVENIIRQIEDALERLRKMMQSQKDEKEWLEKQLKEMIVKAEV